MEQSEFISSIDIVDYISQYVELEEKNGEFWGLSPFKDENTPSFSVRRETGTFFDFSSGIGGSIVTFVRFYNNVTTRKAIEMLAEYTGYDGEIQKKRKLAASEVAKRFSPKKKRVLEAKGRVLDPDFMDRYEDNDEKLAVWESEGISRASLDRFQVKYDSFSDRLVYPIRNLRGDIVNIGGRTLDPKWKEKKLRKYTYFYGWKELGGMDTVYGLAENMPYIREKGEVILFEGAKSVMLCDSWGIRNTGAILTSHLSDNQLKILIKLGVKVVFALDKEVKIKDDHNIKRLKQYTDVFFLWDKANLTNEKDAPVDHGEEVFRKLYEGRVRYR